jgi:hypothetical protein
VATQPIDPIEEHIAQAMADPKFVASLEEIEAADERGELETVSDEELGRHLEDARRRRRARA